MKSVKTIAALALFAVVGSVAVNASAAEECYRSTECEGDLVCINLACTASENPLIECSTDTDCSYNELCDQGVCKLSGVTCANEYGQCTYDSDKSSCECDSGSGMSSGSACGGEGCQVEVIPDDELYSMCTAEVNSSCEAPPDVNEACTEAQLATCTDLLTLTAALEENCGGGDTVVTDTESVDVSTDISTDADVDADGEVETDGSAGEDTGGEGEETPASGAGQAYEPSAWELAECCEMLSEIAAFPEEKSYVDCISALSPTDCEGLAACEEAFGNDGTDVEAGDADTDGSADGDTETVDVTTGECSRSTECEGDLVCIDLACTTSEEPLSECSDDMECSDRETCDQGVCKPDGVVCANDYGKCTYDSGASYCTCADGSGQASDVACDGTDCAVEVVPDDVLYEMCTDEVNNSCTEPPDVNEVCTEEQIATCTEWLSIVTAFGENCFDTPICTNDTDGGQDVDNAGSSDGDVDADIDTGVSDTDVSIGEDTAASSDTDGSVDVPAAGAGQVYEPDAWEMADCCEELTGIAEDTDSEQFYFQGYLDCLTALEPDDCEGFKACEEMLGDTTILKDDDTDEEAGGDTEADVDVEDTEAGSDGDGDADQDLSTDDDGTDDGVAGNEDTETDEDTDAAEGSDDEDDTETTAVTSKKSDSGCSFVPMNHSSNISTFITALF